MVIAKLIRSYEADIPPIRGESVSNFTPGEWISSRGKVSVTPEVKSRSSTVSL